MEKLEQDNFDINTFSDIEDIYKPTDATIQKELVNSITNLSNLLSNGIVFINYGIYQNLKQTKGSNYDIPKECKVLSDVIYKNSKRDTLRQCKKQYSDSNKSINKDSIDIVVTNADKEDAIEEYFGMDQSMIKPHQDFNFGADSSMLFDQSAIFSNIDMVGDAIANQSMIFMDSNGRNIFSHDDPENNGSMFLNINGLTDLPTGTEGNNSTLVNLADVDNNYISTSDNESNNSTACWDDMAPVPRIPGSSNEEYSADEDDQPLKNEFDQAFAKTKYSGLDIHDMKRGNMCHTHPSSSFIQVHQYQVIPDAWNDENDEINLAKATLKKQGYKNSFPHKKLYPLVETPYLNESNSSFVNNYNDTINSSFIKDDLSITKDIVNKNVQKFNSLGLETEEYIPKSSSSFVFSKPSVQENTDTNTSSLELNTHASSYIIRNASSPLPTISYSSSPDTKESIPSVNNFASLQSKFNQNNNNSDDYPINKSNQVWSYKMKQESHEVPICNSELHQLSVETSAVDDVNVNGSILIPEKLNIKERINDIEASILVNNSTNETSVIGHNNGQFSQDNNSLLETIQQDESLDTSIANTTIIKSNVIDDILDVSIGTVKNHVFDLEQNNENYNIESVNHSLSKDAINEKITTEVQKLPITEEDINDAEDEEEPIEFLLDNENIKKEQNNVEVVPEILHDDNNGDNVENPIETLSDNEKVVEIEPEISMHKDEETLEEPIEFIIENEDQVEDNLHQDDNEDEEPIEFLNDEENVVEEPIEYIDNNEKIIDQSIQFDNGTENLINNELIDGNLEDHIIIEEEDSIVGNAIEEALENKSFVIQENPFMDEPYANDLSFTFDGHAAFHEAMKIFDGDTPLETIKEEEEEEEENILNKNNLVSNDPQEQFSQSKVENIDNSNNNEAKIIENIDNSNNNEVKIIEMIENNFKEPDNVEINDMSIHSFIHENQDIVNSMLPLVDNTEFDDNEIVSDEAKHKGNEIEENDFHEIETEEEKIETENEIIETENKKIETEDEKIETEDEKIEIEDEKIETEDEIIETENEKNETEDEKIKTPIKESKANAKDKTNKIIKNKNSVPLKNQIKKVKPTSEQVSKPKTRIIRKSNKSLVLPTRNLIPTINKVDPFIANNNCVKAFTSTSLRQNIISTRPVEHEVTISFSDFDKNIRTKSLSKSKPIPKIIPKTISKPATKPTPKKSTLVYGSNVKPLSTSKPIKSSTQKSISKNKKSIISKPRRKINSKIGKYTLFIKIYIYSILNVGI